MESEGERRKIYGLTPLGEEVVRLECARLEDLARAARAALDGAAKAINPVESPGFAALIGFANEDGKARGILWVITERRL